MQYEVLKSTVDRRTAGPHWTIIETSYGYLQLYTCEPECTGSVWFSVRETDFQDADHEHLFDLPESSRKASPF